MNGVPTCPQVILLFGLSSLLLFLFLLEKILSSSGGFFLISLTDDVVDVFIVKADTTSLLFPVRLFLFLAFLTWTLACGRRNICKKSPTRLALSSTYGNTFCPLKTKVPKLGTWSVFVTAARQQVLFCGDEVVIVAVRVRVKVHVGERSHGVTPCHSLRHSQIVRLQG